MPNRKFKMPQIGDLVTTKDHFPINEWESKSQTYVDINRKIIPPFSTMIYLGCENQKSKYSQEVQYQYLFLHEGKIVKSKPSILKPKKWLQKTIKVHHEQK